MHRASSAKAVPVLDVLDADDTSSRSCRVRAWKPAVPGIAEVLHARIVDYAYPLHAHDTWTVLILDAGAIRYDLDSRRCGVSGQDYVAVLPPGVVHDGQPGGNAHGFRKRNLYLKQSFLPTALVGAAVDHTTLHDGHLRAALSRLHQVLAVPEGPLDAEARLALIGQRLYEHLAPRSRARVEPEPLVARQLRTLLDEHLIEALSLAEAGVLLDRSVPHLVRSFTRTFGISPPRLRHRPSRRCRAQAAPHRPEAR